MVNIDPSMMVQADRGTTVTINTPHGPLFHAHIPLIDAMSQLSDGVIQTFYYEKTDEDDRPTGEYRIVVLKAEGWDHSHD